MTNNTNELSTASRLLRSKAGDELVSRHALIRATREQFEAVTKEHEGNATALLAAYETIRRDALIGRMSGALMLAHNDANKLTGDKRLKRTTFEGEAENAMKDSTSTAMKTATKWFDRLRADAGFRSESGKGGARHGTGKGKVEPTVTAPLAPVASAETAGEPKALTIPGVKPESDAVQIGAMIRASMQKVQASNPKIFESDDFARRTWAAFSNFMQTMKVIELDATKAAKVETPKVETPKVEAPTKAKAKAKGAKVEDIA